MRETYEQFTERVMTNRSGKIKDIDAVARGRIFIAKQAKDLGMVDEIGGIEDAITYAAKEAGLKPGEYEVRSCRHRARWRTCWWRRTAPEAAMPFQPHVSLAADSVLRGFGDAARDRVQQAALEMVRLLQDRPVVLGSRRSARISGDRFRLAGGPRPPCPRRKSGGEAPSAERVHGT